MLVNAMHITASVFINDNERGLFHDFEVRLEKLASHEPVSNVGDVRSQSVREVGMSDKSRPPGEDKSGFWFISADKCDIIFL